MCHSDAICMLSGAHTRTDQHIVEHSGALLLAMPTCSADATLLALSLRHLTEQQRLHVLLQHNG